VKAKTLEVMKANLKQLSALCRQFGFNLENSLCRLDEGEATVKELKVEIIALRKTLSISTIIHVA
jgi:hypothetical protein